MKEEDKKIEYRPELADKLECCMRDAIKLYKKEPREFFYFVVSLLCKEQGDLEGKELFLNVSKCFNKESRFGREKYYEHYYKDVKLKYGEKIADITSASAARLLFIFYKEKIENSFNAIDTSNLSKQEKHMVEHYKNILLSPTRNPNLQISEGSHLCYYDSLINGDYKFNRQIESEIEFIERNCQATLDIFRTPDEEIIFKRL